jgi:hypothetical protein
VITFCPLISRLRLSCALQLQKGPPAEAPVTTGRLTARLLQVSRPDLAYRLLEVNLPLRAFRLDCRSLPSVGFQDCSLSFPRVWRLLERGRMRPCRRDHQPAQSRFLRTIRQSQPLVWPTLRRLPTRLTPALR